MLICVDSVLGFAHLGITDLYVDSGYDVVSRKLEGLRAGEKAVKC